MSKPIHIGSKNVKNEIGLSLVLVKLRHLSTILNLIYYIITSYKIRKNAYTWLNPVLILTVFNDLLRSSNRWKFPLDGYHIVFIFFWKRKLHHDSTPKLKIDLGQNGRMEFSCHMTDNRYIQLKQIILFCHAMFEMKYHQNLIEIHDVYLHIFLHFIPQEKYVCHQIDGPIRAQDS